VPSLDQDFAGTRSLVDRISGQNLITFTRASSGTFTDSTGTIRTATTNLLLQSEEFDNASWSKSGGSVSANSVASPSGTTTADTFAESALTEAHFMTGISSSAAASTAYTFSFYAKSNGRNLAGAWVRGLSSNDRVDVQFNLSTGAIVNGPSNRGLFTGASASIQALAGGWYRCTLTGTSGAGETSIRVLIAVDTAVGTIAGSYAGDGTSGLYLWGAQLEASPTVGEYIPTSASINSAPRFNHDPVTGQCLGLLVEEQRVNSIPNNTMVGAVAGTPGTLPTAWTYMVAPGGVTRQIVGTGSEDGIAYMDVRFSGTTTDASGCSWSPGAGAALTGQTWAGSVYWKLVGGTTAGVTSFDVGLIENTSGGVFVTGAFYPQTAPTSTALIRQRATAIRALSGGGTVGQCSLVNRLAIPTATAIDFTLRIGLPQLELGAFATTPILTTGTSATRSADVATITGTAFSRWYSATGSTVFVDSQLPAGSATASSATRTVVDITDGTSSNRLAIRSILNATLTDQITVRSDGGTAVNFSTTGSTVNASPRKIAAACQASDSAASATGSAGSATSDTGAMPLNVNQLTIGSTVSLTAVNYHSGTISRLTYWPVRLGNSALQALTR
jgi:hypothetical protein